MGLRKQAAVDIKIRVDAPQVKAALEDIRKSMAGMGRTVSSIGGNMSLLTNAFRSWVGFLGVREITHMSDQMQNLDNRLKIVTDSAEDASRAFEGIVQVARETNTSVASVGDVYNRLAISLADTGASTREMLGLSELLINTFRLSGATTAETTNTIIQLSQAFSSGELRGQELRSVMEQNGVVARLLRKEYGKDIYKKAKDGALSVSEVIRVLSREQERLNEQARKLAPTFEQTLTKSLDAVRQKIHELNIQYDLSSKFATGMQFVVDNLGIILSGVAAIMAAKVIPAMVSLYKWVGMLKTAFFALSKSNVILLALQGLAIAGTAIYLNWDKVWPVLQRAGAAIVDFGAWALEGLASILKYIKEIPTLGAVVAFFEERISGALLGGAKSLRAYAQSIRDGIVESTKPAKKEVQDFTGSVGTLADKLQKKEGPKTYKASLAELNRQFQEGAISVAQYQKALQGLELQKSQKDFLDGASTLAQYDATLIKIGDKFRPGSGLRTGLQDFITSAGTISQGIAKVTTQAFDHLSDRLATFVEEGKFSFREFTLEILKDLNRMIIRAMVVRPIAEGILGAFGTGAASTPALSGGSYSSFATFAAKGAVMTGDGPLPLRKYADGGIARSPQMAIFGEGSRPEAYVPLPDGRNIPVKMEGASGITFVQNITINSDGSVDSSSTINDAKALGDLMKRVTIDTIIQQRRPGGLLA